MKGLGLIIAVALLTFLNAGPGLQAQGAKEKKTISLDLSYHRLNNELPYLMVNAKSKTGKKFELVEGVDINFFINEESAAGFMGTITSNKNGIASLKLPDKFSSLWDSLEATKFIATITSNEEFNDQSSEIEISKARIELSLEKEDSVKTIRAKVLAQQMGNWIEVPGIEVKLMIRRLLSDLPAGEEEIYTTDENGELSVEFTMQIPGDANGKIMIGAKIEDNEMYGNLIATKGSDWGLPQIADESFDKRTLWATRDKTPLWLLIFPNLIIAGVWGTILYLIYQIAQIRKIGKAKGTN